MYQRILVPLDGSKRAEAILPHVEQLAQWSGAEIFFLQVLELMPVYVDPYEPLPPLSQADELERRSQQTDVYLAGLVGEFREKGIKADRRIVQGPVVDAIINVSDSLQVDLVAMASHGRSGLSRVFYGSVAAGVLQRVERPLLLIRSRNDD